MKESEYLEMPWSIEDTIENLKEIKELMKIRCKNMNVDGKGERDAEEVEFDFDRAINALEKQITKKPISVTSVENSMYVKCADNGFENYVTVRNKENMLGYDLNDIDQIIEIEKELVKKCKIMFEEMNTEDKLANKLLKSEIQHHYKIAEWLEELKFRRVLQLQVEKEFFAGYKNGKKEGYNKAIDDFKKILTIEKIKEYAESDGFININNCSLMILDIAEQLKAGDAK